MLLKLRMALGVAARVIEEDGEVRLMLRAARRARVGWRGGILIERERVGVLHRDRDV